MQKFDPIAFREFLKEKAVEQGKPFKNFFAYFRLETNHHRPDKKKCLRLMNLVGDKLSLTQETIAHISTCCFCCSLVKWAWLSSTTDEDRAEAFVYFMRVHKIPVERFEAQIFDDSGAKKAHSSHFGFLEVVCFKTIDESRRNHRKICKQCDTLMRVMETIPLPDLS